MQRLEVNGAVWPLYGRQGVKEISSETPTIIALYKLLTSLSSVKCKFHSICAKLQ